MSAQHGKRPRAIVIATALLALAAGGAWSQPAPDTTAIPPTVENPRRIAAGADNEILVSDRRFGAIVGVDKTTLEPHWSYVLPNEGQPFGIATMRKLIYVGNTRTKNVEVYKMISRTGGVSLRFDYNLGGVPEGAMGDFENPVSIAVDNNQRLVFVLDAAAKKVRIFDQKGAEIGGFAPADSGGIVMSPVAITVDEGRAEILVADYGDPSPLCSVCARKAAGRILGYNYNGALQFQINGDGLIYNSPTRIGFARVQGMATSPDGRIFAADPLGNRIFVLDRSGVLIDQLGVEGTAPGELMLPLDVFLDPASGDLFISNNRGARRIEALRGAGR